MTRKTDLARQYGALNRLNRVTVRSGDDWIGIAACGHTYHEVREALQVLGFDDEDALRAAGIEPMKLAQEAEGLLARFPNAAANADEKRRLRAALYQPVLKLPQAERSRVVEQIITLLLAEAA